MLTSSIGFFKYLNSYLRTTKNLFTQIKVSLILIGYLEFFKSDNFSLKNSADNNGLCKYYTLKIISESK